MDKIADLPVFVPPELAGNSPAGLNAVQLMLLPYLAILENCWWALWWSTLGYLFVKYLLLPLVSGVQK
jgi:hypothetical protein